MQGIEGIDLQYCIFLSTFLEGLFSPTVKLLPEVCKNI
jgi:hypothetical protein